MLNQTQLTPNTKKKIIDYLNITNDSGIETSNRLSDNFSIALEETYLETTTLFRLNWNSAKETVKKSILTDINKLFTNHQDFGNFLLTQIMKIYLNFILTKMTF